METPAPPGPCRGHWKGNGITDLRISITHRCNYKCVYCRTGNEGALYGDLPFADYLRMARVLTGLGIQKVRITGGEPLLRKGVVDFVRELAKLRTTSGEDLDIALTTNGHLLADMAQPLKDAGLRRVTVSMDAVDPERFARITRVPDGYDNVLAGIRVSGRVGLWPVKVNCVLMRGFNEDQIIPFGMFAREEGVVVRFIEFMPLEEDRVWSPNTVVTLDEILRRMGEYRLLVEIPHARSETARRYRFEDGIGEIGIIAPVSHPFCGHCSRIRITSDGKIRTCLYGAYRGIGFGRQLSVVVIRTPGKARLQSCHNGFSCSQNSRIVFAFGVGVRQRLAGKGTTSVVPQER